MFNTLPYNSFPASTAKFEEGKNDTIQAEIDAMKDGTNIDSFGDVETALALKANSADMETALATKTNLSNIAPTFDATSGVYEIGDKVIYEGVLYEFTSAHSTVGDWDSSEVQPVKVSELINSLESGLTNLNSRVVTSGDTTVQSADFRCRSGYACISVNAFVQNVGCVIFDIVVSGGVVTTKDCMTGEALSSSVATSTYSNGVLTVTFANSATYTAIYQTPLS